MFVSTPKRTRRLAAVAIIATLAVASLGFAASNTVPASKAGDGSGAISGYTVSAVHYNLNSTDPASIDAVTFTLDSEPASGSTIRVKLVAAGTTWYVCTNVTTAVTCTTTGATVATADELEVVVAD